MHPRLSIEKEYHVTVDQPFSEKDFKKIQEGIRLSDGFIKPDRLYIFGSDRCNIGIVIHSGKKRVIRRLFAYVGYNVIALDRVRYATLQKETLKQGKWRELTQKEIADLKKLTNRKKQDN
jgi:23S rRNA pseudouridine2605 synthase